MATAEPLPPEEIRSRPAPAPFPRWSLGALSLVHAAVFVWTAVMLPWPTWTVFAVTTALVGALHLATGGLALLGHRVAATAWRVQSFASLAYLAYLVWGFGSSALYLRTLYGGLGPGVAAALVASLLPAVLFTVPLAAWGIASTGGLRASLRVRGAVAIILAIGAADIVRWQVLARLAPVPAPARSSRELSAQLATALPKREAPATAASLHTVRPARCEAPPDADRATIVVTYVARGAERPVSKCLQAKTPGEVMTRLADLVRDEAPASPLKIDAVTGVRSFASRSAIDDALTFRPAIDGACSASRCLMPWQLVALDLFNTSQPIRSIPDLRFGVSRATLERALGGAGGALARIETASAVVTADGKVEAYPLVDGRKASEGFADAARTAERFIHGSQAADGRFEYMVHPFTGESTSAGFSLARQAGTTLAYCDHARSPDKKEVAARSLALLASLERRLGRTSVLVEGRDVSRARIGQSALPLAAFIRCRELVGKEHDPLIGRLAKMLLAQQRADGGFHHGIHRSGGPKPGPSALYADGQAVLALSMLERLGADQSADFPPVSATRHAVERAMTYFADAYWTHFAAQFFFIEENWHCIAAAASLAHHRHDRYERFCIDYMRFKARLFYDEDSGVRPEFVGGHGIGHLVPPHNTPSAGYGESLVALIAVKRARNLDVSPDLRAMDTIMRFLIRNQWTTASCFACTTERVIPGSFSEHIGSPQIRIDYVQHAWSALAGGAEALGFAAK
jgi:hypothetical protein